MCNDFNKLAMEGSEYRIEKAKRWFIVEEEIEGWKNLNFKKWQCNFFHFFLSRFKF